MSEPIIRVDNIVKTYDMGEIKVNALNGITLIIDEGDFFIITGRNGSGKSTLLHQLGLLDRPDSGTIHMNGKDVTKMHANERSSLRLRQIGYIFQEYALMAELTALENVMLPLMMTKPIKTCRKKARDLLVRVGLEKKMNNLPRQLSGGEQQKVSIARAIVNDPTVIFADEPTANLDSIAAKDILSLFEDINKRENHTIVMITHEQDETHYANKLIQLSDGRLV